VTLDRLAVAPTTYLRALGPLERFFWRYSEHNPAHFLLVAEFDTALDPHLLRDALAAVQRRHALLSACIEDDPETRLGFYRTEAIEPINLTLHRDISHDWQVLAAEELARPFNRSGASRMRATLLIQATTSTLLLVFDHAIADGISSVVVLNDLLAALNGQIQERLPVPESLESLVAQRVSSSPSTDVLVSAEDVRMAAPGSVRPFDPTPPHLHRVEISCGHTTRLISRCREERTTVHAAIVAAASRARGAQCGEEFVRTYSPINVRELVGDPSSCAVRLGSACTGMALTDGTSFWDHAREVSDQLTTARSAAGLVAGSVIVEQHLPIDADCHAAEQFLCTVLPFELLVTNLGVQNFDNTGPLRPRAIWGPIVLAQLEGEYVTGAVTYGGQLRMVTCGHTSTNDFLDEVVRTLVQAVR
jgi:hypothetical protein